MKILFTCGGTAGHINPAIAVAGKIKQLVPDAEILFVGAQGMMEENLVPREGYEIKTVTITNLQRSMKPRAIMHNINTAKNVVRSIHQAKRIIKVFKPDVAVGTGGYVCYSVLRAAHSLGVPTIVHESNAVPGLTTRLLSKIADCVMVGFAAAGDNYPNAKRIEFTGTPVRPGFGAMGRDDARRRLGIAPEEPFVLSVWGSLGSDFMNGMMAKIFALAAKNGGMKILHSAGSRGFEKMKKELDAEGFDYEKLGIEAREYIYDMPTAMSATDLIICRSGASTLSELQLMGKPAVLVPSPNVTGAHQEKNARVLENAGAAVVVTEGSFSAQGLYERLCALLADGTGLSEMSRNMQSSGVKNSTEIITDIIFGYIK